MAGRPPAPGARELPDDDAPPESLGALLAGRFQLHTRVRGLIALTLVSAAVVARFALEMSEVDVAAFGALAGLVALYDLVAWKLSGGLLAQQDAGRASRRLLAATYGFALLDFLALTCAIWLVGGARSPFAALYLLHVIVSVVLLTRRDALILTAAAFALLVLLVLAEGTGVLPPRMPRGLVMGHEPLTWRQALTLLSVYAALFGLSTFLLLGLTRELRRNERRILMANAELARLSEQRKDFLHIATHNLRSPLGAATMMLHNLLDGLAGPLEGEQRAWVERSLRRLEDAGVFLSDMQTLAAIESDIIRTQFTRVDPVGLIEQVVEDNRDLVRLHEQTLRLELADALPPVVGSERLLREALVNYLTNAVKYTPAGGHIVVRVLHRPPHVRFEVRDDGPGIPIADQPRLFREFVRLQGKDGGQQSVPGTGLGLSIVKRVALAHGGRVGVESAQGVGSNFFLELPELVE